MTIEGFDYKAFAESMAEQAEPLAPLDLSKKDKEYLVRTMLNFNVLAGESLSNETSLKLNAEQAEMICQVLSEWTFHKVVDLTRSGIKEECWDAIMQKIAFTLYEVAKQSIREKLPNEQLLQAVEYHVVKAYKESVTELKKKNVITKEVMESALAQSNIDKMAEKDREAKGEEDVPDVVEVKNSDFKNRMSWIWGRIKENKVIFWLLLLFCSFGAKLYFHKIPENQLSSLILFMYLCPALGFLTKKWHSVSLIYAPLLIFACSIVMYLLHYDHAGWYLTASIVLIFYCFKILVEKDIQEELNRLETVREEMQALTNPDKMYERLGVDIISLQVGAGLLSIADPDQDGLLLAKLVALRQHLTDDYGYIIPNVRIMDTSQIEANEYVIKIRNNIVERCFIYPEKYMVIADEWGKHHSEIPENAIVAVDPVSGKQAYWLSEETAKENEDEIKFVNSEDVVINHLSECVIKYVDEILTDMDVEKYIKLVEGFNPSQINYLMEYLTIYDIRRIFVNLIREKVSIKDISFVFMKLCEFVKYTTEIEVLSKRLRVALDR